MFVTPEQSVTQVVRGYQNRLRYASNDETGKASTAFDRNDSGESFRQPQPHRVFESF